MNTSKKLAKPFTACLNTVLSFVSPLSCISCGSLCEKSAYFPLCKSCYAKLIELAEEKKRRCSKCGRSIVSEIDLCTRCKSAEFFFDSAYPIFEYYGIVRELLLAYKTKKRRSLKYFFADIVYSTLIRQYKGYVLVPVPPRPNKIKKVGWDQIEDISQILQKKYNFPVSRILKRYGNVEQKSLDLQGRKNNLKGKIKLISNDNKKIPDKLVLFDDIMTTGTTLSECSSVLKENGAKRVEALCLASD